jgi:hypothetical protein
MNKLIGGFIKMSFKIWSLALMLSLVMAISCNVSGANTIGQNSIRFNTVSWCATPAITVPSYTGPFPQIHISESHSNTATSWGISMATISQFPRSSNAGVSAMTVVPRTYSPLDEPKIITSTAITDTRNTLSSLVHSIDITPADPTAVTSDGSSLDPAVNSVTIEASPGEPDAAETLASNDISLILPPLVLSGDPASSDPTAVVSDGSSLDIGVNPVTIEASPEEPDVAETPESNEISFTLPPLVQSGDPASSDPTAVVSDGSSLDIGVNPVTVDASPEEPDAAETPASNEISLILPPLVQSGDPASSDPTAVVSDGSSSDTLVDSLNTYDTYEPKPLNFPAMVHPSQEIMMLFRDQMRLEQEEVAPPEELP